MNVDKSWSTLFYKVGKIKWFAFIGGLWNSCWKTWHLDFAKHLKDKGWLDLEKVVINVIDIENWLGNIQLVCEFKFLMKNRSWELLLSITIEKEINVSVILSNNLKILRIFNFIIKP